MATYREIDPSEYLPDGPATAEWAAAVSENLTAVLEGDSTSPGIRPGSLQRLQAGDVPAITTTSDSAAIATSGPVLSAEFLQFGSVRVLFAGARNGAGSMSVAVRRTRGGVATDLMTYTVSPGSYPWQSVDVMVQPGDRLAIIYTMSEGVNGPLWSGSGIFTGGELIFPVNVTAVAPYQILVS